MSVWKVYPNNSDNTMDGLIVTNGENFISCTVEDFINYFSQRITDKEALYTFKLKTFLNKLKFLHVISYESETKKKLTRNEYTLEFCLSKNDRGYKALRTKLRRLSLLYKFAKFAIRNEILEKFTELHEEKKLYSKALSSFKRHGKNGQLRQNIASKKLIDFIKNNRELLVSIISSEEKPLFQNDIFSLALGFLLIIIWSVSSILSSISTFAIFFELLKYILIFITLNNFNEIIPVIVRKSELNNEIDSLLKNEESRQKLEEKIIDKKIDSIEDSFLKEVLEYITQNKLPRDVLIQINTILNRYRTAKKVYDNPETSSIDRFNALNTLDSCHSDFYTLSTPILISQNQNPSDDEASQIMVQLEDILEKNYSKKGKRMVIKPVKLPKKR